MSLPQDQHNDDDEEYEADQATADVDTGCEQHAVGLPIGVTWQTGRWTRIHSGGAFDRRHRRAGKAKEFIEDTKDRAEDLVDRARDGVDKR